MLIQALAKRLGSGFFCFAFALALGLQQRRLGKDTTGLNLIETLINWIDVNFNTMPNSNIFLYT